MHVDRHKHHRHEHEHKENEQEHHQYLDHKHRELDHQHQHHHHHDHDHEHEHEEDVPLEENGLWLVDNIELKSVGIDIGSSGTQVIFSLLKLRRMGEDLSSRYVVVSREPIYLSPVVLTPYLNEERIDDRQLGKIIDDAYNAAGLAPEEIDTGVVLLTGEAIRRENAQAIADVLALHGGKFVCAAAGHNMEAQLAAYGSGAALVSHKRQCRILNIDIGGGTTKLAVVENGRVIDTAAVYVGGRLIVVDENQRIVRLDPGGKHLASQLGYSWNIGDTVTKEQLQELTDWMAKAVISAVRQRPLSPVLEKLYLTKPLEITDGFEGVMFSGGVAEYVYDREERSFGDLGKYLGEAMRRNINKDEFPWTLMPAGECIRATVVGASQYSVQVSGNTNYISNPELLPIKNLQVLHPAYDLRGMIEPEALSTAIRDHFTKFDLVEGEANVALAFRWFGDPSYERVSAFARGIQHGLRETIGRGKPVCIILDGDIARTVGRILKYEFNLGNEIISIDGIILQDFDFIDMGKILQPSETVPVTVKSLIFNL